MFRISVISRSLAAMAVAILAGSTMAMADVPLIDAHSQLLPGMDVERIVPLMDEAGVSVTILSATQRKPELILDLAEAYPDRIIPAMSTKLISMIKPGGDYVTEIARQLAVGPWRAMQEILMWHAAKGKRQDGKVKAPQIVVAPDDPRVSHLVGQATKNRWPAVIHIEFSDTGAERDAFMAKMEALVSANPGQPFAMIHMGQLEAEDVRRLIDTHGNLHFLTSHADPIKPRGFRDYGWIDMFDGGRELADRWRGLMMEHPDRFVLAFDNVWPKLWMRFYARKAALWRAALNSLPEAVAHKIAHENAECLWHLPPLR